ncbi:MAG: MYXO-CTERM sorting domain-containing protein [Myxococcota bacterium]
MAASSITTDADAAVVLRFSQTTGGNVVSTGNSLGLSKELDLNGPGTEDSIGTFMTLVEDEVDNAPANPGNPWPDGTTNDWTLNGSEAQLVLPDDAEVLYAELVWGGSWGYGSEDVFADLGDSVILSANGDATTAPPDPATGETVMDLSMGGFAINYYSRSADVTDFVAEHGSTFYAVEGVPATQDTPIDEVNAAGWSLIVVYRDSAEPIRNLTVFVGGDFVDINTVVDYEVSGFCTPPSGAFEGFVTLSAVEGDADREGDSLTIAQDAGSMFVPLVGPNNPQNNFFASQINDFNGDLDTTGTFGDANHDAFMVENVSGGRQGWDVTTVPISSAEGHLVAGQTSAILRTETDDDSFMPTSAGLAIAVNAPDFTDLEAGVAPGLLAVDQNATASVSFQNVGLVDATGLLFTAELPAGLELDSFSINGVDGDIDGNPVATADLTTGVNLGNVAVGVSMDIEFVVTATAAPEGDATGWVIEPMWTYDYISCVGEDPLTEPLSTTPLNIEYDAPEGSGTTGGAEGEEDGLDETAADDSASAEQGEEDDDASASADDGDTGDDSSDGTGIASASAGMAVGDDGGCGCRSTTPTPAWMLALLTLVGLVRRRRE